MFAITEYEEWIVYHVFLAQAPHLMCERVVQQNQVTHLMSQHLLT